MCRKGSHPVTLLFDTGANRCPAHLSLVEISYSGMFSRKRTVTVNVSPHSVIGDAQTPKGWTSNLAILGKKLLCDLSPQFNNVSISCPVIAMGLHCTVDG